MPPTPHRCDEGNQHSQRPPPDNQWSPANSPLTWLPLEILSDRVSVVGRLMCWPVVPVAEYEASSQNATGLADDFGSHSPGSRPTSEILSTNSIRQSPHPWPARSSEPTAEYDEGNPRKKEGNVVRIECVCFDCGSLLPWTCYCGH
jgi:hypothetical protein